MGDLEHWWTVRLVVEEHVARSLSGLDRIAWGVGQGLRSLQIGDSITDEEELTSITFELEAPDASSAEARAQARAASARQAAGLKSAEMPVAWVAPLQAGEASSQRFLACAGDLLDLGQFEMAVVAAQIHFEIQVRTLLDHAAEGRGGASWARRLADARGVGSLQTDHSKAAVQLLLGVDPTDLKPEWSHYVAHRKRRNDIVHEGQAVGRREGMASIAATRALWTRLSEAARLGEVG